MASEQQWIVRFKHYVTPDDQSNHIATVNSLTADSEIPFKAEVDEAAGYSIGGEAKGYLAKFDDETKAQLEALQEVCSRGKCNLRLTDVLAGLRDRATPAVQPCQCSHTAAC